ncbi:MAG: MotA/TolQ/ExbB proton channel family protein [Gammaproteobacteria bacterium]|nr:MotA/TolQ/ExbB proton channel family protein [Gammaproteobacteria bacterium]
MRLPNALALLFACLLALPAVAEVNLEQVAKTAAALRAEEAKQNAAREAAFQKEYNRQQALLNDVQSRRATLDATTNALSAKFDYNEKRVVELQQLLEEHQGNLGELFGVTRQVASDALGELSQSLIASQYLDVAPDGEDRTAFLRRLASARALPSIEELERLWLELQREMTASGQVARYTAPLRAPGAEAAAPTEVLRVGPFTASAGDRFLAWLPSDKAFTPYARQPASALRDVAATLARANGDGYVEAVVDPARGALLSMVVERPNWFERIELGGMVGYVTIGLGALGALAWLGQVVYLLSVRAAVAWQLRNPGQPSPRNPLGRVLAAAREEQAAEPDMAELAISAAVLREVPRLERFQGFLRLAVAAGPLLGLIGTVIGMIITFQTITASGASDPKLVAHGIGQAMIATVLGLGIAIPLLFANSVLAALSRAIVQILDEHGEGLLADTLSRARRA